MEKFNIKKHWVDFLREDKLTVLCDTEEKAKEFFKLCESKGLTWCTGGSLTEEGTSWNNNCEETCYFGSSSGISYSDLSYASRKGYTIVEFEIPTLTEKFDPEKHWDDFKSDKLVVNCPTEKLAKEFLAYLDSKGLGWSSGKSLLSKTNWVDYAVETCYSKDVCYCDRDYYESEGKRVVEFQGLVKPDEIPTLEKETIEVIYHGLETIVLIKGKGKYAKGTSKCMPEDVYNRDYGLQLAYNRARQVKSEASK